MGGFMQLIVTDFRSQAPIPPSNTENIERIAGHGAMFAELFGSTATQAELDEDALRGRIRDIADEPHIRPTSTLRLLRKDRVTIPDHLPPQFAGMSPNKDVLDALAAGHRELVSALRYYLQDGVLTTLEETVAAMQHVSRLIRKSFNPASLFATMYCDLISEKVTQMVQQGFFSPVQFMRSQPRHFGIPYFRALLTFLTEPEKLQKMRPAWLVTFRYALQGHPNSVAHGVLGIISHIMADLTWGVLNNLNEVYPKWRIQCDPRLAGRPPQFFIDELFGPVPTEETAFFRRSCRKDHYDIDPFVIHPLTGHALDFFRRYWADHAVRLVRIEEKLTVADAHGNGRLATDFVHPMIVRKRRDAFDRAFLLGQAQTSQFSPQERIRFQCSINRRMQDEALIMANRVAQYGRLVL